jgi:hypothetical protein
MSKHFFERQTDRDCSVHSLNNAVGRRVITPSEVVANVNERAREFAAKRGLDVQDSAVRMFRDRLTDGGTFFAADAVWQAARSLGRIGPIIPVPGFGGSFAKVAYLPPWVRGEASVVVLGLAPGHRMHAIAIRNGQIVDSVHPAPVPLTDKALAKSLEKVFAAYVVQPPNTRPRFITRLQPAAVQK